MANVGDVLVGVKANTSQAETAFRRLQEQFAATRGQLAGAQSRLDAVSTAMAGTTKQTLAMRVAALGSARGIGTVRSSLASLAAMSIGVRGTFGTLTSALLFMSLGNLTAIGVIGGIMAIGKAFQFVKDKIQEKRDALRAVEQELQKFAKMGPTRGIIGQIAEVSTDPRLAELRARRARAEALARAGFGGGDFRRFISEKELAELQTFELQLKRLQLELRQLRMEGAGLAPIVVVALDPAVLAAERAAEAFAEATRHLDAMSKHAMSFYDRIVRVANVVKDSVDPWREVNRLIDDARTAMQLGLVSPAEFQQFRADQITKTLQNLLPERNPIAAQVRSQWQELGQTAAEVFTRGFVRSFLDGKAGFGNLFKNLLATIFEEALLSAIRRAFKKTDEGTVGKILNLAGSVLPFAFQQSAPGSVAAGTPTVTTGTGGINLSVTMPAANNPLAVARDAQWQAALRESIMVARQQGFRV